MTTNIATTPAARQIAGIEIPAHVKSVTVLTGGDPDGSIVGGLLRAKLRAMGIRVKVVFDRWLPVREFPRGYVIVSDIPLNNRETEAARAQIEANKDRILMVVGHHAGDEAYSPILGNRALVDTRAPSCPAVLAAAGEDVPEWAIRASNMLDAAPGRFPETALAKVLRWAFDNALVKFSSGEDKGALDRLHPHFAELASRGIEAARASSVRYILAEAAAYEPIFDLLQVAMARVQNLGVTDLVTQPVGLLVLKPTEPSPLTSLFALIYSTHKVAVIQSWVQGAPITTVALDFSVKGLNLLQAFGLQSGTPSRIVLPGDHVATLARVMQTLQITAPTTAEVNPEVQS